jgi:hypothetical protein
MAPELRQHRRGDREGYAGLVPGVDYQCVPRSRWPRGAAHSSTAREVDYIEELVAADEHAPAMSYEQLASAASPWRPTPVP